MGCHWCDTKYSWDFAGGRALSAEQVWQEARDLGEASLLVVTGGEPLEHPAFARLLEQAVVHWERVEVETSGVRPPPLRRQRLFYNVSPKLPSATSRWAETWRHARLWMAEPNVTFKLVVGDPPDLAEARRLIAEHEIPPGRVMLMPEGMTDEALRQRSLALAEACTLHGFRLSPRLHISLWGARRGV